jgi:hypothetical protein
MSPYPKSYYHSHLYIHIYIYTRHSDETLQKLGLIPSHWRLEDTMEGMDFNPATRCHTEQTDLEAMF